MIKKLQLKLIEYISKRNKNIDSAFTLVELIVVIVIIGILSSIAVPAFRNASDKARQKEATSLVSTYLKAAQAFNTEYGSGVENAGDLSEYISVTGCSQASTAACSTSTPSIVASDKINWVTPSGAFTIILQDDKPNERLYLIAVPTTVGGKGVSACYNNTTGASKLIEATTSGTPNTIQC